MSYQTLGSDAVFEFAEKKSVFITHAFFCATEADALAGVERLRAQYADATHNVFAYSLHQGGRRRMSDDGEPSGTAGMPVLNTIQKTGLEDLCVVVTRYFGGILLGAGGLVRAYTRGAAGALEQGGRAEVAPFVRCTYACGYDVAPRLRRLLEQNGEVTVEYAADVRLTVTLEQTAFEQVEAEVAEAFFGMVQRGEPEVFLSRRRG